MERAANGGTQGLPNVWAAHLILLGGMEPCLRDCANRRERKDDARSEEWRGSPGISGGK